MDTRELDQRLTIIETTTMNILKILLNENEENEEESEEDNLKKKLTAKLKENEIQGK